MGLNTLATRATGETITASYFNDFNTALNGSFVGRDSSGAPATGQSLGTNALPWASAYITSLILNGSAVDTTLLTAPKNRVVSGATRATSDQPAFIDPAGLAGGASFTVTAATTNLVLDIDGTTVTFTTNVAKSSLTTAPAANNTAAVNDADAADQESTRTWGEYGAEKEYITIDAIGSEISALNGTFQAFKINDGANDEYFFAYVDTTNNRLTHCMRGFFYDSSLAPINRIKFADNDTITLMKLAWVFAENDAATIDVTYRNPVWSTVAPGTPQTGDYWYDMTNQTWKRYTGSTFDVINRTFIGWAVITTADCIAARSFDFYANHSADNNLEIEISTTEIIKAKSINSAVSVFGNKIYFGAYLPDWNITTDLAATADLYAATEQASTIYYLYLDSDGKNIISDISPYWRPDLYGHFHPHNPWRCIGEAYNSSGSDIVMCDETKFNLLMPLKTVLIQDIKAANTPGGSAVATTWTTRVLNTISTTSLATLASNQFTLMPGKYSLFARSPVYDVNAHKARIRNITGSSTSLVGSSAYATNGGGDQSDSIVSGTLNIFGVKTFELQYYAAVAEATIGLGVAANAAESEVYGEVYLTKIN